MASLDIYKSIDTNMYSFLDNLKNFLVSNSFMTFTSGSGALRDINDNDMRVNFQQSESIGYTFDTFFNNTCIVISAGRCSSSNAYEHCIHCAPCVVASSAFKLLYNDENKLYTEFKSTKDGSTSYTDSAVYSNFRAIKYADNNTKYLSLGLPLPNSSITLSTHTFKYIDDPAKTKNVLVVTDSDGYISLYDTYTYLPWYVSTTVHNGNNIGLTKSINAYKYTINGYYCDNIYYFDGGYSMPGDGVTTISGIKFLKLGNSNLFIKME